MVRPYWSSQEIQTGDLVRDVTLFGPRPRVRQDPRWGGVCLFPKPKQTEKSIPIFSGLLFSACTRHLFSAHGRAVSTLRLAFARCS